MASLDASKFFAALQTIHQQLNLLLFVFSKDKAPVGMDEEEFQRTKETWLEIAHISKGYSESIGGLMDKL